MKYDILISYERTHGSIDFRRQGRKRKRGRKIQEIGTIRCIELIIPLHYALDIAQLELVVAVELLDDFAVLVPVVGSAGPENGRRVTNGR